MLIRRVSAAPESLIVFNCLGSAARLGLVADYRQQASKCPVCRLPLAELTAQCAFLGREPPEGQDAIEILSL
jgi:hypothetical protein